MLLYIYNNDFNLIKLVSESESDDGDAPGADGSSYAEVLNDLSEKWIQLEMKHRTSKRATDDFWLLAKEAFPKLYRAKLDGNVHKPIPQFPSQRIKLIKKTVPPINLKLAYLNKETNEIEVVEGEKTPVSKYNPRQYEKLFEVATVQVIIYYVYMAGVIDHRIFPI